MWYDGSMEKSDSSDTNPQSSKMKPDTDTNVNTENKSEDCKSCKASGFFDLSPMDIPEGKYKIKGFWLCGDCYEDARVNILESQQEDYWRN
jgi:hypothetical protein